MSTTDKPLVWLHGEIKTPPLGSRARIEAGYLLRRLQAGEMLDMPHSRSMPSIAKHVHELRVVDDNVTWRIVYRIDEDAIVIADVFAKKRRRRPSTQSTMRNGAWPLTTRSARGATMDKVKQERLAAAGWRTGDATEFLELTVEEAELVEVRLRLARALRSERERLHLSQAALALRLHSSQSRVAKIEAGDPSVSLDLMVRALLGLGAGRRQLAEWLAAA